MNHAEVALAGAVDALRRQSVIQKFAFVAQRIKFSGDDVRGR